MTNTSLPRRLPNFFLVGAMKAGTTTVYDALRQHPDIFMSPVKEPNFFAWGGAPVSFFGPGDESTNRLSFTRESTYTLLFKEHRGEPVVGEASTSYLGSKTAAERIHAWSPEAKIVIFLRDPVDRAYSTYRRLCVVGRETLTSFEAALEAEPERRRAGWEPIWWYREAGVYAEHVARYLEAFGESRVFVRLYDDLRREPSRVMRDLYEFLAVDPSFVPDTSVRFNRSAGVPSHAGPLGAGTVAELREFYRQDVCHLQGLIGRDLKAWLEGDVPRPS